MNEQRMGGIGAILDVELGKARQARRLAGSVILVEGESDRRAIATLAPRLGIDLVGEGMEVIAMAGASNATRFIAALEPFTSNVSVLCDKAEAAQLRKAIPNEASLFVCDRDLEDELIRAVGIDAVLSAFAQHQDLNSWRRFCRQPEQRGRPNLDRVRRFLGNRSRKIEYAAHLTAMLTPENVPEPLRGVLGQM